MGRGWKRFTVATVLGGAAGYLLFGLGWSTILAFMHWFEFLSDVPGLSGLFVLFACLGLLVVGSATLEWVCAGFRDTPEEMER